MPEDPFKTETGLIDNIDFFIPDTEKSVEFVLNTEYDNMELVIIGTTNNPDHPEWTINYGVGPGWVTMDGGKTVVHESNKEDKGFNANTKYGRLIDRVCGSKDGQLGLRDLMASRVKSPKEAKMWKGLAFHMTLETRSYKDRDSGEQKESHLLLPVAFLGEIPSGQTTIPGSQSASPQAPVSQPVAAAQAPASAPAANPLAALAQQASPAPDTLEGKARQIALDSPDWNAFVGRLTNELPEVANDEALLASIGDQSEGGFFAKAKAGS